MARGVWKHFFVVCPKENSLLAPLKSTASLEKCYKKHLSAARMENIDFLFWIWNTMHSIRFTRANVRVIPICITCIQLLFEPAFEFVKKKLDWQSYGQRKVLNHGVFNLFRWKNYIKGYFYLKNFQLISVRPFEISNSTKQANAGQTQN